MKVQRVELSAQKRKALHIILKEHEVNIEEICNDLCITKGTMFSRLKGGSQFKETEYIELLKRLGVTDEELEECSESYLVKFLLKKLK